MYVASGHGSARVGDETGTLDRGERMAKIKQRARLWFLDSIVNQQSASKLKSDATKQQ
jgi:hypothetical protein